MLEAVGSKRPPVKTWRGGLVLAHEQLDVLLRISRSRERSDRRDVNSWTGRVNAELGGT